LTGHFQDYPEQLVVSNSLTLMMSSVETDGVLLSLHDIGPVDYYAVAMLLFPVVPFKLICNIRQEVLRFVVFVGVCDR